MCKIHPLGMPWDGYSSGSIDGYSSFMGFNPDKQVGLVELCSCEGVDMPMEVRESLAAFIIKTLT
jgi:hypothetical protein